ncbi:MAG: glycerate-2-kinase family protein, partial [Sphingomonadales bacterium]
MQRFLPSRPSSGRLLVLGAGKAAAAMAKAVEDAWGEGLAGLVVVPDGYELELESIELQCAGHPIPDRRGAAAARKMMILAGELGEGDTLLALFSGGGSALLPLPKVGLSLADKQRRTEVLLKSGAPISEINQLRRSLSAIKGGGLARAAKPARVLSFIASDVPGDDPADVASGPSILPKAERDAGEDGDQVHVIVSAKEALAAAEQAARGAGLEVA